MELNLSAPRKLLQIDFAQFRKDSLKWGNFQNIQADSWPLTKINFDQVPSLHIQLNQYTARAVAVNRKSTLSMYNSHRDPSGVRNSDFITLPLFTYCTQPLFSIVEIAQTKMQNTLPHIV